MLLDAGLFPRLFVDCWSSSPLPVPFESSEFAVDDSWDDPDSDDERRAEAAKKELERREAELAATALMRAKMAEAAADAERRQAEERAEERRRAAAERDAERRRAEEAKRLEAAEAQRMFYAHDRKSVRELAALWRPDIDPSQNKAYVARAKELQKDLETAFLNRGDEDEKKRA